MPHDRREIFEILDALPIAEKLAHLVLVCLVDDKPEVSAEVLIGVAQTLAKRLPPTQQAAVAWHLAAAIEELKAEWH